MFLFKYKTMDSFLRRNSVDYFACKTIQILNKFATLLHAQSSPATLVIVLNENTSRFRIKIVMLCMYVIQGWYHLLFKYTNYTLSEKFCTGFFLQSFTLIIPIMIEFYFKRDELSLLCNSIQMFSKHHKGELYEAFVTQNQRI